jgi:putative transcriptional regulator
MNNFIKEHRLKNGLTQEELSKLVNVRRETIVFLEQNKYIPSLKLGFDLSKVLGVKIEDLFSFDNE